MPEVQVEDRSERCVGFHCIVTLCLALGLILDTGLAAEDASRDNMLISRATMTVRLAAHFLSCAPLIARPFSMLASMVILKCGWRRWPSCARLAASEACRHPLPTWRWPSTSFK